MDFKVSNAIEIACWAAFGVSAITIPFAIVAYDVYRESDKEYQLVCVDGGTKTFASSWGRRSYQATHKPIWYTPSGAYSQSAGELCRNFYRSIDK